VTARHSDTEVRPTAKRPQRVAMVVHSAYPWDERVKREADALVDAGYHVDVLCLRYLPDEPAEEVIRGVHVRRISLGRTRSHSRSRYAREYAASFAAFLLRLTALNARHRYDLVQVHTLPDFLIFSALPCRLTGARLVLDIHDLMPELYQSKFGLDAEGRTVRMLRAIEKVSVAVCDHVITASEAFKERLVERGLAEDKVTVVLNTADPALFPAPLQFDKPKLSGGLKMAWHGTMVARYGLDLLLNACALVRDDVPGLRVDITGTGDSEAALKESAAVMHLDDTVHFHGWRSHAEMPSLLADADVGVVVNRPDEHIDMAYPTKLFEFVQMGLPVISTRTKILEQRFDEDALVFCDPDAQSVADAIRWVDGHREEARGRAERARSLCEAIAWDRMGPIYVNAIAQTIGKAVPIADVEPRPVSDEII
jgi:glycosyltransferase involved in cell wall biosynthesis